MARSRATSTRSTRYLVVDDRVGQAHVQLDVAWMLHWLRPNRDAGRRLQLASGLFRAEGHGGIMRWSDPTDSEVTFGGTRRTGSADRPA
jgi:hypothetical protein